MKALTTVKQFSIKHPAWSESALRALIHNAKARRSSQGTIQGNGFDTAIIRVGRKVLIDEEKFFEIVREGNAQ